MREGREGGQEVKEGIQEGVKNKCWQFQRPSYSCVDV
jgi:hypothetical protein